MSKVIDETGNKYGYLTVIKRSESNSQGKAMWLCKCKCGKETIVSGVQLRSGKTKSCGCLQKERTSQASLKDITGQTIGNFYVLNIARDHSDGRTIKWHCRCNLCGNENVYISASNMKKQESCGCLHESKGNRKIAEILENNNIEFIKEKRFSDCKFETGYLARFDFYLPKYNTLIEYDGIQHFIQGNGIYDNEDKFELTIEHDLFKEKYAKNNGYNIIRIPYTHYDNIVLKDLLPETSNYIL